MRRFLMVTGVAVGLAVLFFGAVALGQGVSPIARVQPLVVAVQQSVPFSLTLAVPVSTTETMTVSVPAVIDINLEIRLTSGLTPVVEVAPPGSGIVTINGSPTAPTADADTSTPGVGDDVQVGQVRWRVLSAEDLGSTIESGNQFIDDAVTSGRFIKVRFEVENLGKDMATFAGLKIVDDKDRSFVSSDSAFGIIEPSSEICVFENINPNVPKICTDIYEVPEGATGLQLEVTDLSLLGQKTAKVDLGLD